MIVRPKSIVGPSPSDPIRPPIRVCARWAEPIVRRAQLAPHRAAQRTLVDMTMLDHARANQISRPGNSRT